MSTLPYLPYIPLEVAENIIDQLGEDVRSLRSCALTCRGWNRHARYHLVASILVQSREDLYSIYDYFASKPRMTSFVRSLSMSPGPGDKKTGCLLEVLPVDLLKLLPNLRRYCIVGVYGRTLYRIAFHDTTFIRIKTYLHVEELHLQALRFRTGAELARVLIALPRLRRLHCRGLIADNLTADTSRFRDKCNMLSEVTSHTDDIVNLIIQMSLSTLRILRCNLKALTGRVDLSELKHLHSVDITTYDLIDHSFDQMISVIATVPSKKLRSLTISFLNARTWPTSSEYVRHPLDDAILALDTSVVVSMAQQKPNRRAFWSKIVQRYLPRLHEAKLLQVQCSSGAYNMCTSSLKASALTSLFHRIPRWRVAPGPRDQGDSHGRLPGRSILCHRSG
ncbi:hypothetical protein OH76DRAFT_442520 [Lentinus brumalis]|uniref:F-box domain-containing protein n=1 Tax=Lentinus brumalis TaxID=2498619 RepID=A0A371CIP4_9APHY|nr:hypothetical protein OH76DRAFT_442520 [Polyporus brumalis]